MKEKKWMIKKKKNTHQCLLNLTSWCLSLWSMIMIYFLCWTVFKSTFFFFSFLSCYPDLMIIVTFPGSVFLFWIHYMDHVLFLTVYFSFFKFISFYTFQLFPEWQKYLECESLCSSCTRIGIIAMIIKKNMTKLYMHHFHGGLVYCCIVTHEYTLLLGGSTSFVGRFIVLCALFLCLYHFICLICKLISSI